MKSMERGSIWVTIDGILTEMVPANWGEIC